MCNSGIFVLDVDECADNIHDCDENANCTNIPQSYRCTCNPPYFGDGQKCINARECFKMLGSRKGRREGWRGVGVAATRRSACNKSLCVY